MVLGLPLRKQAFVRRTSGPVDRRRRGDAAFENVLEHRPLLPGDNVGRDADRAVGAKAPEVEVVVVVPAPDAEVGGRVHHLGGRMEVAVRFFVPHDVRDLGELQERVDRHVGPDAAGDVVDDHG